MRLTRESLDMRGESSLSMPLQHWDTPGGRNQGLPVRSQRRRPQRHTHLSSHFGKLLLAITRGRSRRANSETF